LCKLSQRVTVAQAAKAFGFWGDLQMHALQQFALRLANQGCRTRRDELKSSLADSHFPRTNPWHPARSQRIEITRDDYFERIER
jgi:hypothetical protein